MATPQTATDSANGFDAAYLRFLPIAQRLSPTPSRGHVVRRAPALAFIGSLSSLVALLMLPACSREPEAVTRAYELMSRRMCKDAIPALKTALAEKPDDARIPRALCEASLCARSQEAGSKETNSNIPPLKDLANYCEQGYTGVQEAKLLLKKAMVSLVLGVQGAISSDKVEEVLAAAVTQHPNDPDVRWQGAYMLIGDHRRARQGKAPTAGDGGASAGSQGVAVTATALGAVRANAKVCIVQDRTKARRAIVRRGGAKIFVPKSEAPEARFEPGSVFAVAEISGERVQFNDAAHEHWKPGTGWIAWKSEEQDCMWGGCQPPNWCGGITVPLDGRYVTRYMPGENYFSHLGAVPTGGITIRPGSLKYLDKTVSSSVKEFAACHKQHVLYRDVAFEEREAPVREVPATEVFLISDDCPVNATTLIREYPEWDESVIESLLKGEVRQGMPSQMLQYAGWRAEELFFERDAALVLWRLAGAGSRVQEVTMRNGRVQ